MNHYEIIVYKYDEKKILSEEDFLNSDIINSIYDIVDINYVSDVNFHVKSVKKIQKKFIMNSIRKYDITNKEYIINDNCLDIDISDNIIPKKYVELGEEKFNRKNYDLVIQTKNIYCDTIDPFLIKFNYDLLMSNFLCNRKNPLCNDIIHNNTPKQLINYEVRKIFYVNKHNFINSLVSPDISKVLAIPNKYKIVCFFPIFSKKILNFPSMFKASQLSTIVIDSCIRMTNSTFIDIRFKLGMIVLSASTKFIILPNYDLIILNGNYVHKESSLDVYISKGECYNIPTEIYYCF